MFAVDRPSLRANTRSHAVGPSGCYGGSSATNLDRSVSAALSDPHSCETENEPLPICTQGSNRPTGLPQTVQPSMAQRCGFSPLFPLRSLRMLRRGTPQILQDLGGAARGGVWLQQHRGTADHVERLLQKGARRCRPFFSGRIWL